MQQQQHEVLVPQQPWKTPRQVNKSLSVYVQGVEVYQNKEESMMEIYKDLWRSEEDHDNKQEFVLANENVGKLVSKDDSGNKATKTDGVLDRTIANMCNRMKIPIGKILCDHGPYAPYGMCDFGYRITLPQSKKIMKAQDGEDVGEYKLTDMVIIDTSNPDTEIPNPRIDAGVIRRDYTEDKKSLLREMGININEDDGPSAKVVFGHALGIRNYRE